MCIQCVVVHACSKRFGADGTHRTEDVLAVFRGWIARQEIGLCPFILFFPIIFDLNDVDNVDLTFGLLAR